MREKIRPFRDGDAPAVRLVHSRAFGGREGEARLVELLHAAGAASISLVATTPPDGRVVGHVLFSPVELLDGHGGGPPAMAGLAPVAVLPEHQGQGIGSRLIRDGLEACREAGYAAAVVLGRARLLPPFRLRAGERGGVGQRVRRGRPLHSRGARRRGARQGGRHGSLPK